MSIDCETRFVTPVNFSPGNARTVNVAVTPSAMPPTRLSGTATVRRSLWTCSMRSSGVAVAPPCGPTSAPGCTLRSVTTPSNGARHREVLLHRAQRIEARLVGLHRGLGDLDLVAGDGAGRLRRGLEAVERAPVALELGLRLGALRAELRRDDRHEELPLLHLAAAIDEDLRDEAVRAREDRDALVRRELAFELRRGVERLRDDRARRRSSRRRRTRRGAARLRSARPLHATSESAEERGTRPSFMRAPRRWSGRRRDRARASAPRRACPSTT